MADFTKTEALYEKWKKKCGTHYETSEENNKNWKPGMMKLGMSSEVTRDGNLHTAESVADLNPLWSNREYAAKTKYKCIIAPPMFCMNVQSGGFAVDWPEGFLGFYSGSHREWYRPWCEGDQVSWVGKMPSHVELKKSKFSGENIREYSTLNYYRQGGEIIGSYQTYETWADIDMIAEMSKYATVGVKVPEYDEEYLKKVYETQDNESKLRRGAEKRYWEDVQIGDVCPPVVRGPYNEMENYAQLFSQELNPLSMQYFRWISEVNPTLGANMGSNGYVTATSSEGGVGSATGSTIAAPGKQPEVWLQNVVTNWMGDDGFLWKTSVQIRFFIVKGDIIWCNAKVVDKFVDNGKYCVVLELLATNQDEMTCVKGYATVILPSREHGDVVYPEPTPLLDYEGVYPFPKYPKN